MGFCLSYIDVGADTVTVIGDDAFKNCTWLQSIHITDTVTMKKIVLSVAVHWNKGKSTIHHTTIQSLHGFAIDSTTFQLIVHATATATTTHHHRHHQHWTVNLLLFETIIQQANFDCYRCHENDTPPHLLFFLFH